MVALFTLMRAALCNYLKRNNLSVYLIWGDKQVTLLIIYEYVPSDSGDQDQLGLSRYVESSLVSGFSGLFNGFSIGSSVLLLVLLSLGDKVGSSLLEVSSALFSGLSALLTKSLISSIFASDVLRYLLLLLHIYFYLKKSKSRK